MNVELIKTTHDRQQVLSDLLLLEKQQFSQKKTVTKDDLHAKTLGLLDENKPTSLSKAKLDEIKKTITELPTVQISVAFYPAQELIDEISSWARRILADQALLEISVNPTIIAGIQISWKGIFFDGSLNKKL